MIGLTIGFLFQIISFCTLGAIIEICVSLLRILRSQCYYSKWIHLLFISQNGQMYEGILLCDWFLLPCSDQKLYSFLMLNAQMAKALTIGGVAPLNMSSCVSVRAILSFHSTIIKISKIILAQTSFIELDLFLQILKTIYSYLMILFTFIAWAGLILDGRFVLLLLIC